jgi:hypothetical protein
VNFLACCALLHYVTRFSSSCRRRTSLAHRRPIQDGESGEMRRIIVAGTRANCAGAELRAINRDSQGRCALHRLRPYPEFLSTGVSSARGRFSLRSQKRSLYTYLCEIAFLPPRTQKPG